jgi:hypothetical protein
MKWTENTGIVICTERMRTWEVRFAEHFPNKLLTAGPDYQRRATGIAVLLRCIGHSVSTHLKFARLLQ